MFSQCSQNLHRILYFELTEHCVMIKDIEIIFAEEICFQLDFLLKPQRPSLFSYLMSSDKTRGSQFLACFDVSLYAFRLLAYLGNLD